MSNIIACLPENCQIPALLLFLAILIFGFKFSDELISYILPTAAITLTPITIRIPGQNAPNREHHPVSFSPKLSMDKPRYMNVNSPGSYSGQSFIRACLRAAASTTKLERLVEDFGIAILRDRHSYKGPMREISALFAEATRDLKPIANELAPSVQQLHPWAEIVHMVYMGLQPNGYDIKKHGGEELWAFLEDTAELCSLCGAVELPRPDMEPLVEV